MAARLLQGLASGAALGPLSAIMIDAHPERGTIASSVSPGTGSGLGALLSGLTVQFLPGPTHTIYLVLAVVLTAQALLVLRLVPAGGGHRSAARDTLRPQVAIPAAGRSKFLAVAPVVLAAWGLSGFYAALSPALYTTLSGTSAVWPTTLPLFVLVGTGTLTTLVLRNTAGLALTVISAVSTLAGLAVTVAAVELAHPGLYLLGSAIAGIGFGTGFQGPVRSLTPLVAPDERPALMSAVFMVAYIGLGIAAIIPGALIAAGLSLPTVTVELAGALAALTALSLCATLWTRAR
jgi:MFS family permease